MTYTVSSETLNYCTIPYRSLRYVSKYKLLVIMIDFKGINMSKRVLAANKSDELRKTVVYVKMFRTLKQLIF